MRLVLFAAFAALPLAACATVSRGTTEIITVTSIPNGADVLVTGRKLIGGGAMLNGDLPCVTPCAFDVKRSDDITLRVSKEGYETEVITLQKEIAGAGAVGFAGNALIGGVIGAGVDAYNSAALDHKPNPVTVTLQPTPAVPQPTPTRPARSPTRRAKPAAGT